METPGISSRSTCCLPTSLVPPPPLNVSPRSIEAWVYTPVREAGKEAAGRHAGCQGAEAGPAGASPAKAQGQCPPPQRDLQRVHRPGTVMCSLPPFPPFPFSPCLRHAEVLHWLRHLDSLKNQPRCTHTGDGDPGTAHARVDVLPRRVHCLCRASS